MMEHCDWGLAKDLTLTANSHMITNLKLNFLGVGVGVGGLPD